MRHARLLAPLLAVPLLLAGCAATRAATDGPAASGGGAATAGGPPEAAAMVCSPELGRQLVQVLHLPAVPANRASWVDHRYTCTWELPAGPLVLTVQAAGSDRRAADLFTARRTALAPTTPLAGLGREAFATATGTVVLVKDDMTLTVDASALPPVLGTNGQQRSDLAYEVASDVLGCWTGDE